MSKRSHRRKMNYSAVDLSLNVKHQRKNGKPFYRIKRWGSIERYVYYFNINFGNPQDRLPIETIFLADNFALEKERINWQIPRHYSKMIEYFRSQREKKNKKDKKKEYFQ